MTPVPTRDDRRAARSLTLVASLVATLVPSSALLAQAETPEPPTATEGADYRVYGRWGAASSVAELLTAALAGEVLLVGEEHDDMPGHALEADLLRAALARSSGDPARPVVLSLEMFERDVQYVLDEYLAGLISEDHFLRSVRPWDDYDVRYRPLVEAAREAGAPVVAANAPRRYVNRVTREGPASLEALSDRALAYLPPLPYPGPSERYRAQWDALMAEAMAEVDEPPEAEAPQEPGAEEAPDEPVTEEGPDHTVPSNAIHAQALWDAAMGHAIATALIDHLGALVVHFAGSFHVAKGTGIPERIENYRPGTRVTTVVMTKVDDIDAWSEEEHADQADFVVLTLKPRDAAHPGGRP